MHLLARRKAGAHGKPIEFPDDAPWSLELRQKFLFLNYRLGKVITSGKAINRGALRSRLIEHFFDLLQRLESTKQTASSFAPCCFKAIVMEMLMKRLGINLVQPKRQSNSGVIPGQHECVTEFPLGSWLALAEGYFRFIRPTVHVPLVGEGQLHDRMKMFSIY
jgi:hypothetical protein